jgi:thioredoxin-related protein
MKFLTILFTLLFLSLPLKAYELLVFSVSWCSYCVAFNEEVAPEYNDTVYAETLPLTIIDAEHIPAWFTKAYEEGKIKKIKGTPTYIIWNEKSKAEVNRFVGYNGKEWFYEQVAYWVEHYKEYYGQ